MTTTVGPSTTLDTLAPPVMTPPPTTLAVPTTDLGGYVGNVYDGRTFDLQVGDLGYRRVVVGMITVADVGTCEGVEARNLLASIIAGHLVRIDSNGVVWRDDIDVAGAMVAYGRATANSTRYTSADMESVDFDCAATTTTTIRVVVVTRPKPKPTTKPKPKATTPVETEPAAETEPPATEE